jgi:glucosamine-phosphate N-acetyltransferase
MSSINIRDLSLEDICDKSKAKDFIVCLNELAPTDLSEEQLKNIFFERQYEGQRTLIALVGDRIVGTGSIFIEKKYLRNGGKSAHIEDVAVLREFQLNGIGTMIVQHLIEIAELANAYKIVLDCSEYNRLFYIKLGFDVHGSYMKLLLGDK